MKNMAKMSELKQNGLHKSARNIIKFTTLSLKPSSTGIKLYFSSPKTCQLNKCTVQKRMYFLTCARPLVRWRQQKPNLFFFRAKRRITDDWRDVGPIK